MDQSRLQYKTPCYQFVRQIFMLIMTLVIAIMTAVVSFITAKINEHVDDVQQQINNQTLFLRRFN